MALIRLLSQGGPGYILYTAYSGVVLVAGGSGISYVMSILDDMLQKHANGKSHVRIIEVIWSVMDLGEEVNSRMFRSLDLRELTGATCQIRCTLCSPSSAHSCSHAHHRMSLFPSGSTYTGPGSHLAHHACCAQRFQRECTSAQDVLTSLTRYKA